MTARLRSLRALQPLAAALLLATAPLLQAQTLRDAALETLYTSERNTELQRLASQRLAAQPDDTQALLALSLVAMERDDAALRRDVINRARGCAEKLPQAAECHYAHGVLLGVQAMNDGMFAAARSMGTVRDALAKAHELDPAWYPGRSALQAFHVLAPGMMGGNKDRAAELARSAPRPEQAAALQARMRLAEEKPAEALALLQPLLPVADPALRADVVQWGTQAGLTIVNRTPTPPLLAQAQAFFERLSREHAEDSSGPYGLSRVKGEQGDWAASLALLERSAGLRGASRWPLAYRTGIAQQQLGQLDAARASYKRFVDAGKGQKAALEDARKRLEALSR
jgi:hypothetical protein